MQDKLRDGTHVLLDPPDKPSNAPFNGKSGYHFTDINQLILAQAAKDKGYESAAWMTFEQANRAGSRIKEGEKATTVQFTNWKDKQGNDLERPQYVNYPVYNVEQFDKVPDQLNHPEAMSGAERVAAQVILNRTQPTRQDHKIGSWMAAARHGLELPESHLIDSEALSERLHNSAHTELFVMARIGSKETSKLRTTALEVQQAATLYAAEAAKEQAKPEPSKAPPAPEQELER